MKLAPALQSLLYTVALLTGALGSPVWASEAPVPYDLEKFRPVLDDSKLQAPTSSPAKIEQGDFEGQSNQYLFLDETGQNLIFTITGDSKRSELRQLSGDWDTSTPTPQRLIARLKVFVPDTPQLEQFTFMQIHDKKNGNHGLNKPLLRLTWRQSRSGKTDHLWAAIRTPETTRQPISLKNLSSEWVDLGPRPEGFFDAEILVQNGQMKVILNGRTKVNKNVNYWNGLNNYFKAGVYNQDPGTSKVAFETLRYADSDDAAGGPPAKAAESVRADEPE